MDYRAKVLGFVAVSAVFAAGTGLAKASGRSAEVVWLRAHNAERIEFGTPALEWSDKLARDAEDWADELVRRGYLQHAPLSNRRDQGENLWIGTRGYLDPEQMIEGFILEKQYFKAGVFPQVSTTGRWSDVGHYTQIVWPTTRAVGCAVKSSHDFDILVCRYWPAGNMIGTPLERRSHLARH